MQVQESGRFRLEPAYLERAARQLQGTPLRATLGRTYVLAYLWGQPDFLFDTLQLMHGLAEIEAPVRSGTIPVCVRDLVRYGLVWRSLPGPHGRIEYGIAPALRMKAEG